MILPGAQDWSRDLVVRRVAFERKLARMHLPFRKSDIGGEGDSKDRGALRSANDKVICLGRAAEFALAGDNFELAVDLCFEISRQRPTAAFAFALFATIASLLGLARVRFSRAGIEVMRSNDNLFCKWPSYGPQQLRLMRLLLPAVSGVASHGILVFENNQREVSVGVSDALVLTREYQAVVNGFSGDGNENIFFRSLLSLEEDYSRHLSLLRSDAYYWSRLEPRGSLIDWHLLALWTRAIAAQRLVDKLERWPPTTKEALYIRSMASQFASFRLNRPAK